MEYDNLGWKFVRELNWKGNGYNSKKCQEIARLWNKKKFDFTDQFSRIKGVQLYDCLEYGEYFVPEDFKEEISEESSYYSDAVNNIVGLGREAWEECMRNPLSFVKLAQSYKEYIPNFSNFLYTFDTANWEIENTGVVYPQDKLEAEDLPRPACIPSVETIKKRYSPDTWRYLPEDIKRLIGYKSPIFVPVEIIPESSLPEEPSKLPSLPSLPEEPSKLPSLPEEKLEVSRGRGGYSKEELKSFAAEMNLPISGTKDQLVTRILGNIRK